MQDSVKRRQGELAAARRALVALAQRVPTVQAAADTGIHQSQVSRLFRGQFTRISPNVRALVDYGKTGTRRSPAPRPASGKEAVIRAALRTWDTTPEGARALVRLLKSVQEIRGPKRAR